MADRWYELEGEECAGQVVSICRGLETTVGAPLRQRWLLARSLYERRDVSADLAVGSVATSVAELGDLDWSGELYNVSRSAVDTGHAEIAARQRPQPMFLTTDADWRTKRKAKKLGRFVEAVLHQSQGARYSDAWELGEDVFRDAELAVGGAVKVTVNLAQECIELERVPAYEILVDPVEARNGNPRNWFHHFPMDHDSAVEQFTRDVDDEQEVTRITAALDSATDLAEMMSGATVTERTARTVRIFEAWHLPSADKPGKHIYACTGGLLCEEEWTWPWPPFAILVWSKEAFGVWGTGLVETHAAQHAKVNELARNMHERVRLGTTKYIFYQPGTVDESALKGNDGVQLVVCNDMTKRPYESNTPAVTEGEVQLLDTEIQRYYNLSGVPQMNAESRKDPGVESGVALETLGDQKAVRFIPKARAYELLFVRIGELVVRAMRDLAVAKPGFVARFPGKKFLETIPWKDVDMPDDMFVVRVAPVSAMSRDPAERLEIVEKLTGMGYLSRDKYLELLGMPDLDSLLSGETAETQWVEKMVDRYLDVEDDDDLKKKGGYREPDGYLLSPVNALATVGQHYFDSMVNDAPEYNLDLLRRFMRSLQKIIEKSQAAPPAPQGPALVPGQPAVPQGAPGAAVVPPQGAPVGVAA